MFAVLNHFHIPGCRIAFNVIGFYEKQNAAQTKAQQLRDEKSKYSCTVRVEVREIGDKFEIPDFSFSPLQGKVATRGVGGARVATSLQAELQHWIPKRDYKLYE